MIGHLEVPTTLKEVRTRAAGQTGPATTPSPGSDSANPGPPPSVPTRDARTVHSQNESTSGAKYRLTCYSVNQIPDPLVPLIQRLTSGQFAQILDDLDTLIGAGAGRDAVEEQPTEVPLCRCGCAQPVATGRKFVNQDHYSVWLSRKRFFGKNRRD